MYNILKNVQILIALLKEYNIRYLVLSPGSRNVPFVHSVEEDPFFTCYSVVDERGAAYFALGLAKELKEPVLISCTSSTATSNYFHAVAQACEENVPLVVLTADRNPINRGQMENQMIDQIDMFHSFCRKAVDLPTVTDRASFKYCERLVNEALLELDHHGTGPVQINFPAFKGFTDFSVTSLPKCRKIDRIDVHSDDAVWLDAARKLSSAKKILFLFGEGNGYDKETSALLDKVAKLYHVVISVEHMSNIRSRSAIRTYPITEAMTLDELDVIVPEILVSFQGNFSSSIKEKLRSRSDSFRYWRVSGDGKIKDTFHALTKVFECSDRTFLEKLVQLAGSVKDTQTSSDEYLNTWKSKLGSIKYPEKNFSNFFCIKRICEIIPAGSLLHLSILNSIRMTNFFPLNDNVTCYANIGAYGIDGSFSTFIGQARDYQGKAFLLIGDLSFLYDINALTIADLPKNIRIIVINNHGGCEFFNNYMGHGIADIGKHIAANHKSELGSLAKAHQITHLVAKNHGELEQHLSTMLQSDKPVILELMTDIETDAKTLRSYYRMNSHSSLKTVLKNKAKKFLK